MPRERDFEARDRYYDDASSRDASTWMESDERARRWERDNERRWDRENERLAEERRRAEDLAYERERWGTRARDAWGRTDPARSEPRAREHSLGPEQGEYARFGPRSPAEREFRDHWGDDPDTRLAARRAGLDTGYGAPSGRRSFVGFGPRNYRRSDERIREDVSDRLTMDPWVDAREVDLEVRDGEVTLLGMVETREQRRAAEDCIDDVPGVRDVHNRLKVRDRLRQGRDDDATDWTRAHAHTETMVGESEVLPERRSGPIPASTAGAGASAGFVAGSSVPRDLARLLRSDLDVVGAEGDRIGRIKEVRDQDFLVDRRGKRDVYVPFNAVRELRGELVMLYQRADQVGEMGWLNPPLVGSVGERGEKDRH